MDLRAEKIAKARQKLRDHQEKKKIDIQKEHSSDNVTTPVEKHIFNPTTGTGYKITDEVNQEPLEKFNSAVRESDVNVTEILISTKTNLEAQIENLTKKLKHLERLYECEISEHATAKQKVGALEHDLNVLSKNYETVVQGVANKDDSIVELNTELSSVRDENNNLAEQLEFTKSMLTTKEIENSQLHHKISWCQKQIDTLQLQIQQLTNNTSVQNNPNSDASEKIQEFVKKISTLEENITVLQKDKEKMIAHYEHYTQDLSERCKSLLHKNETLTQVMEKLYIRENSLIEQISEMEVRLQNYKIMNDDRMQQRENDPVMNNVDQETTVQLTEMNKKYEDLQKQYNDSLVKINELIQFQEAECKHDNISINKLNADIASDKIAAQKATEQNKKLKSDVENLEQVIIKLGKDKLELTEMWTHEKQLNKGLALKLAEVEENVKNIVKLLKAKDEEMIRLQNENRDLERKYESIMEQTNTSQDQDTAEKNYDHNDNSCHNHNHEESFHLHNFDNLCHNHTHNEMYEITPEDKYLVEVKDENQKLHIHSAHTIPKQDAMVKLQERFLNIMDQVANLSDEKHRLEHIILQLQNETDTICEYVALYQQQRSLLKKREEERSNQLKIYDIERNKLKQHLEELRDLLLKFANDQEIQSYFIEDQRRDDLTRVKELLDELQNCSFINPKFKNLDINIFYSCSCCSGKIIDI